MMALASDKNAKSVVALSKSPVFHREYSSVSKAIAQLAVDERELKRVGRLFRAQQLKYFPVRARNYWQTDVVNIFREYAPCLPGREFRHKANQVIVGNKPLGIGYGLSSINLADLESGWSLPFEFRRIKSTEAALEVGAAQIKALCERAELAESLQINACDSQYGVAEYMTKVCEIENLVNVIRLRHGNKVFESEYRATGGARQLYGTQYHLIEASGWHEYHRKEKVYHKYLTSIYEKPAAEYAELEKETRRGKKLRIELRRWVGMKMRSKRGQRMKEVEFEIVGLRVLNKETNERVFKQDVFVAVVGPAREALGIEEVAEVFYHRFDLEVTNRLMKQNLFLESYQTPVLQHLDNWLLVVQESLWLLWAASTQVEQVSEKWQQYGEPKRAEGERKTAAQTRKGLEQLLLTFEKKVYLPKKCKKGLGRQKGDFQEPRKQYRVMRKWGELIEIVKTERRQE